jgi:glycosyltransferase involved in cell wall biosynthesis
MRVLFCTLNYPPGIAGGAERQAQLQAEGLVRRGYRIDVVCPSVQGQRSGTRNGVRIIRLPVLDVRFFRTVTYLPVLLAFLLLRARHYQLIHVHLANLQADIAAAAATLSAVPIYLKLAAGGPRGEIGRLGRVSLLTRFYGIRNATVVQAISDEIASDAIRIGVAPARIRRIPNGVVIGGGRGAPSDRAGARERLGLPATACLVLYMGRLEREKGVADLVAVWQGLDAPPGAKLVLVGSAGLHEPVDPDPIPPGVIVRPWTGDVASYLAAADVFALPSHVEGMSNAMLEAMAAGLPVIASRVGAADELIDETRGILIEPGDPRALAGAIRALVDDPSMRERLGGNARLYVERHFSIGSVVDRIEAAYSSMMGAQ